MMPVSLTEISKSVSGRTAAKTQIRLSRVIILDLADLTLCIACVARLYMCLV